MVQEVGVNPALKTVEVELPSTRYRGRFSPTIFTLSSAKIRNRPRCDADGAAQGCGLRVVCSM
jgi:hypothetical protein